MSCAEHEPAPVPDTSAACAEAEKTALSVLIYTKETVWFHISNPLAQVIFLARAATRGWNARLIQPEDMREDVLATADVVFFLLPSGDAMTPDQQSALAHYLSAGGGYAGVHSASFTEPSWPEMKAIVGASFLAHPPLIPGLVTRVSESEYLTAMIPHEWSRTDEWYTFGAPPTDTPGLHVLLAYQEPDGYAAPFKMGYHPIAWTKPYGAGRVFYTALGHTDESYSDETFLEFVSRGIEWAGAPAKAKRVCKAATSP